MGNRYEGIRRLGTGGMADVYLARMQSAGGFSKLVALKQMRADLAAVPEAQALFLREVSLGARISHPFVAQVLDGGKVGDRLYMITEYVDGGDLRQFVTAAGRDRALPVEAICAIGMQLCDALSFVYGLTDEKGARLVLAHRDISPGNVLVSRTGVVKLSDWGVVRLSDVMTSPGLFRGKIDFLPSEVLMGAPHTEKADLFAMGVLLHLLLTGQHPFDAETPMGRAGQIREGRVTRAAGVPDGLWPVIEKALAPADRRWASPENLARALQEYLAPHGGVPSATTMARVFAERLPPPDDVKPDPALDLSTVSFGTDGLQSLPAPSSSEPGEPVAGDGPTPQSLVAKANASALLLEPEEGWVPGGPALRLDGSLESKAGSPLPPRPAPAPAPLPMVVIPESLLQSPAEYAAGMGTETPSARLADVAHLELEHRPRSTETAPDSPEGREAAAAARPRRGWMLGLAIVVLLGVGLVASGALKGVGVPGLTGLPGMPSGDIPLVQIDSDPSGSDVYNDKEKIGTTPLKLPNTWPDRQPVLLRVVRKGYADHELVFPGGQSQHLNITLKKR